ncbi:heparinase II/III family protein [Aestuariibacter sp. A3R04]|uniref:heparinase II/III domain-containing protein n=1 Tax=Aestuariibacter sp. A3R04 TaxID=2841571 RepID=UPI001C09A37F|nr:heparinase II/III family protein [Aestuariibacter sp. A3R04]MBU3020565.1 heparinase II/III family protein [Aestuariibacter sp. A3R04]
MGGLFNVRTLKKLFFVTAVVLVSTSASAQHPNLVITKTDVKAMQMATAKPGRFQTAYQSAKARFEAVLSAPMDVPVPKDGAGGYTHEQHKRNYQNMYQAGVLYQISGEQKYRNFVRDMLLDYAELYPSLDVHPKRKVKSQNPGKFFWQSLNEAMWLVYTIQAYDMVMNGLTEDEKATIESDLLKPVAQFLSVGQPSTFNKVHNHGTWATAGVGMAGYVMNEPEWVEFALYDLEKSGQGGFLKQLEKLFSPDGYYNEGPYYQRFALLPFVTFAKAIENNQPERDVFGYRDGVLMKAIDTTIQLSYNGKFFPINDAIKSKGTDTIELVHGVAVAYARTGETGLLEIADKQDNILLTGDGLKVAEALDAGLATAYQYKSMALGDGAEGDEGALVIMRGELGGEQALLFKPASQGLGHGHFDKLTWQYYDHGQEIVSDYGAARFLNVEAKFGGRYLPENTSYAKQTVAHNTVVIDETSHFNGNVETGNANAPSLDFFATSETGSVAQAHINTAYNKVSLQRTVALVNLAEVGQSIALDIFDVEGKSHHQIDLPLHYLGQIIETNFAINANTSQLAAVGTQNGYQHLWLKGKSTPQAGLAKVTWLNELNGRFYTQTSVVDGDEAFLFTQVGANDPNFNLRNENGFIRRVSGVSSHRFVSVLEPHGEYNPGKEYTLNAQSRVSALKISRQNELTLVELHIAGKAYLIAINGAQHVNSVTFSYQDQGFTSHDRLSVFGLNGHQE